MNLPNELSQSYSDDELSVSSSDNNSISSSIEIDDDYNSIDEIELDDDSDSSSDTSDESSIEDEYDNTIFETNPNSRKLRELFDFVSLLIYRSHNTNTNMDEIVITKLELLLYGMYLTLFNYDDTNTTTLPNYNPQSHIISIVKDELCNMYIFSIYKSIHEILNLNIDLNANESHNETMRQNIINYMEHAYSIIIGTGDVIDNDNIAIFINTTKEKIVDNSSDQSIPQNFLIIRTLLIEDNNNN